MSEVLSQERDKLKMTEESERRKSEAPNHPRNTEEFRMQVLARMAAEETIFGTFRLLGVDIRDQDSLNKMRDDLTYLHNMRKDSSSNQIERRKSLYSNLGALVVGLILALAGYYIGRVHGLP